MTSSNDVVERFLESQKQLRQALTRPFEGLERIVKQEQALREALQKVTEIPESIRILTEVQDKVCASLVSLGSLEAIKQVRASFLGEHSTLKALEQQLPQIPVQHRRFVGSASNIAKSLVSELLLQKQQDLEEATVRKSLATERADVTLPVRAGPAVGGRIHPVSQVFDEIAEIFADMGFSIAEGPDIETDDLNFTKLNIPPEHPARQMHDTFYLRTPSTAHGTAAPPMLLRTHTSPVQVRTMMSQKPPIRVICPGRVYRMDSDATHTPMFHQIEGLVIDETTHFGHLKWCLEEFCKAFFEVDDVRMRFRASHFPFTEPSAEVDVGAEAIGKPGQWLEILGCGMVHPKVIAMSGLDPERYQGWAFGMGLDRITMLKYGIPDLRDMFSADLRWLRHYGFQCLDVPTLAGGMGG